MKRRQWENSNFDLHEIWIVQIEGEDAVASDTANSYSISIEYGDFGKIRFTQNLGYIFQTFRGGLQWDSGENWWRKLQCQVHSLLGRQSGGWKQFCAAWSCHWWRTGMLQQRWLADVDEENDIFILQMIDGQSLEKQELRNLLLFLCSL